jgi:pimeloyl-ACP methyl ester carboxylesterase
VTLRHGAAMRDRGTFARVNPLVFLQAWILIGICIVLATWAHYVFWSRYYFVPTSEDEMVFAQTEDGWRLALARRRPRSGRALTAGVPGAPGAGRGEAGEPGRAGLPPVLLLPGIACNRISLDFGWERWSLSAHLSAAGFDCFAMDLRGHGASRRAPRGASRRWTFDDYVRLDIPAALAAIRGATGHSRVVVVGHSQGGLIGIAACVLYPDRIAALVTLGSPVYFRKSDQLSVVARLIVVLGSQLNRFMARCLAPFSGYWHPPVSEIAINTRNVTRPVYRRLLVNVIENVSSGVLHQFGRWISRDSFDSLDGTVDYRASMARCRQPALFVAADADRIAPPEIVERAAREWGGKATVLRIGLAGSACCDYGHSDLVFGTRAPEEVFPPIRDWLAANALEDRAA